ncbi:DUF115 domain-containing protein [Shewanella sp. VB17]|uniref:6-hydroxymethylpterin diphosphokinase MptE-like protein n=1 Tax=Shewanella sp. VB17 TaxID=2739432 RepID=UPI001564103D|nr:6-hydroxymethylpterin diphosphokinase MptE-like protein [Shewanella sp. VB17]NRD74827.1 DUF115 domain-containing protein [Shewanella sp. VB17]
MLSTHPEISNTFSISQFNECYLPSVNRRTFEKNHSTSLFDEEFKSSFSTPDTLHIIIGLDSGLLANYVMERSLAKGSKFLFVELVEVLDLLAIDIPDAHTDDIFITNLDEFSQHITEHENNLFIVKKKFKLHRSIAVKGNYLEIYCTLSSQVEKAIEHEYFNQSIGFNQKIFIKTQLENVAENLQPATVLKKQFTGKTCIVLAGGPSLDNSIDWIKAHAKQLVIIAVSRVVGKLTKLNIKPDIVVSVDPQFISFDVNKEFMEIDHNTLLINSYHVVPQILGQWQGTALYTGSRLPWDNHSDIDNIKSIGPTVTNSAIEIATKMGFNQILLCGVDFCHSQTGNTHTQGTYGASLGPNIGAILEWVETNAGEMAETPMTLLHAIQSLQTFVTEHPNINIINLSKDAAKINGVNYIESQHIVLEDISDKQRALLTPENHQLPSLQKIAYLNNTLNELTTANNKLKKLQVILADALVIIEKMEIAEKKPQRMTNLAGKLDKMERKINLKFDKFANLIKFYGYYEFSHFLSTKKEEEWTQQDVNDQSRVYYNAFQSINNQLSTLIQSAIIRIKSRIDEYQPSCNIQALCLQWNNDKQWGRSVLWQQQHPQEYANLSPNDRLQINASQDKFYEQFTVKKFIDKTDHAVTPIMGNAFKKLQVLLQNKHLLGISKIVQYSHPFIDTDQEVLRLYHLALSYQYMLENKQEQALKTILLTPKDMRHEAELKQVIRLALNLNKLELARDNFASIIKYSDEYLPQYAHVLKLSEQGQEALAIYLDYLDKYPKDIPVLIKLGIFLAEVGQIEEAKSVFLQALEVDPSNYAAANYLEQVSTYALN